jgi:signal transduction histidine kinase/ligand-binding sensor domain-containing protein
MRKIASGRSVLVRFIWPRTMLAAMLGGGCFFYLLFGTAPVHALDPNKRLTQYIHTSWRIQDGSAPAADMLSIAQTSDGFLWFVAARSLYRFDGVRFVPWALPATVSMHQIANVFGDRSGGLWVVGENEIVDLKGGIVSSHFELRGVQSTQNISEDPDGSLWLVRGSPSSLDSPLCHVTHQALKCFGKDDGIPIAPINSLLADGKGGFWLGGSTALVHWHDGVSETYRTKGQIVSLVSETDGSLWVGMLAEGPMLGLAKWKNGTIKPFVTTTFDGSKVGVTRMISDRRGDLWVGTDTKGVFHIHGNDVDHYGRTEGLSSDTVWTLFEDREGIVWAATTNGIDSFRDPAVTTFSASEGLPKEAAVGILASKDGTIWIANNGSLDRIANGTISSIRTGAGLPGHQVASLLEDRAGNIWVGLDEGLYLFTNGHFRRLPEPNHKPLGMVVGLAEDIDGNIWAECSGKPRKLVRIRDFRVREEFLESKVPPGHSLAADPQGGIWIGTVKGDIVLFRSGVLEKKFPVNLTGNSVADLILAQADGSVLAGSTDGLFGVRDGKAQRMTKKNGLPCNWVYSFVEDKDKQWWLYTECGIVELSDTELHRWWANPETIVRTRVYDVLDGARPSVPSFTSAAYSSDGRVWFVTGAVVQMVDPSRLSQKALPTQTYIEVVIVDRKELQATENLRLSPHPRDLQINYTSPTFLIPQRVKFRYQLDGYERDWHDAGSRRQAFYTDLPRGKYSFRVIASNSDGVWTANAARLDFSVAPAYYQTKWFRTLCATVFLALLWAAYQFRLRQLHHEFNMTLDARVSERTRVARDLHDTLLQSAHGLLLRFQTVSQLLPDRPMEAKEKLDNAIDQTADFITEARDEVQGLRDSTLQSNDLALAISTLGQELGTDSANHPPAFRVALEGEARNLHPILRDEIYKIAAEALRNAFRHSQARQIEVEIRYDNEQFRLRVRDDGKGVDPAILSSHGGDGHYGLPGMQERATLIGGKLVVWSEVDAGTEVELRVPASTAYATALRRSWFSRKAKA